MADPLTENAEPVVERNDDDLTEGGDDAAVVGVAGSNFERFAVDVDQDRKRDGVVLF